MRLVTKRKLKFLLFILVLGLIISFTCNAVVESQLNKEIGFYRGYFEQKKDGLQGIYNPLAIKQIPGKTIDALYARKLEKVSKKAETIDWSKLAYVNYATNINYLCNTFIMFQNLKKYGTKAKLHLMVSDQMLSPDNEFSQSANMLLQRIKNLDTEQVVIKHVKTLYKPNDQSEWQDSLTKLIVFNQTEYDRVIYLDSDADLKDSMDELFFIPSYIEFAAPLAYWFFDDKDLTSAYHDVKVTENNPINLARYTEKLYIRVKKDQMIYNHLPNLPPPLFLNTENVAQDIINSRPSILQMLGIPTGKSQSSKAKFASTVMVINPSSKTYNEIVSWMLPQILRSRNKFDMDLINDELYNIKRSIYYNFKLFRRLNTQYVPKILVLPFGRYGLLSGSIRNPNHYSMLKNDVLGYKKLDIEGRELPQTLEDCLRDSKYIHFSDSPMGKPWDYKSFEEISCRADAEQSENIEQRKEACALWNSLYSSYMANKHLCML
ncbi:N-acetylglucosaminyltransferase [Zygosaccharomyces mellis]|uniref:N-acetylglucosaminyltransferase n=1 Tax=Zygosaccharomyces mellis TaxID=42258 RepID=A0A4C2E929_9SACH|nr:N-acetylglucosaminyltransferase [Zygosaccharomyces mellis]